MSVAKRNAPQPRPVGASELLGRRIVAVDSCPIYLDRSRRTEKVLTSVTLDNGTSVCFHAHDGVHVPIVTFDVCKPRRVPRRKCHGCDRTIDRYAPTHQVYCGECGKP